jgi:hypothetical protein
MRATTTGNQRPNGLFLVLLGVVGASFAEVWMLVLESM